MATLAACGGGGEGGSDGAGAGAGGAAGGVAGGGCDALDTVSYTVALADGYDWAGIRVTFFSSAYQADGARGPETSGVLVTAQPVLTVRQSGCKPDVSVRVRYEVSNARGTSCEIAPTDVAAAPLLIEPPGDLDRATCTAPAPRPAP